MNKFTFTIFSVFMILILLFPANISARNHTDMYTFSIQPIKERTGLFHTGYARVKLVDVDGTNAPEGLFDSMAEIKLQITYPSGAKVLRDYTYPEDISETFAIPAGTTVIEAAVILNITGTSFTFTGKKTIHEPKVLAPETIIVDVPVILNIQIPF